MLEAGRHFRLGSDLLREDVRISGWQVAHAVLADVGGRSTLHRVLSTEQRDHPSLIVEVIPLDSHRENAVRQEGGCEPIKGRVPLPGARSA